MERFFALREKLSSFTMDVKKNTDLVDFLCHEKKMCVLAYVTGIFGKLNELNASMPGKYKNILQMSDRISGFRGKNSNLE